MKHKFLAFIKTVAIMLGVGVALALPFVRYDFGWFVCIALIPLMFLLEWLENVSWTMWRKVWMLYGVGLVFFAIIVQWMYRIHATDLIQDGALRLVFLILSFFLVASSLAIGFIVFGWLYFKLKVSLRKPTVFWLLPAAWMVGEYTRSVLFSIMWLGPGGSIGSHWNFGALGFAASATGLGVGARLLGLYGLGAAIVVINLMVYSLAKRRFVRLIGYAGFAIIIALGLSRTLYVTNTNSKTVRVGVAHLQSGADTDYEDDLMRSIQLRSSGRAGLFILPEYSHFYEAATQTQDDKHREIARSTVGTVNNQGVIVTSRAGVGDKEGENGLIFMRADGNVIETQYKRFLIPAGEYVPYVFHIILIASGNSTVVSQHEGSKTITAAGRPEQPVMIDGVRYGSLACSGAIAPEFYRNLTRVGAEVLTNSASLSSMGIDKLYFEQAKQMARFQAVANARPFVQSARGGESYIIDKDGRFVAETQSDITQYIEASVFSNAFRTLYSIVGEWVLLVALGLLGYRVYYLHQINNLRKKHRLKTSHRAKAKKPRES